MQLKQIISTGALYSPYPIRIDQSNWKGSRFGFSDVCDDQCVEGKGKFYCRHGLAYMQMQIGTESIVVCGYIDSGSTINKEGRVRFDNRRSTDAQVLEWFSRIRKLSSIAQGNNQDASSLAPLHEINRWAAQVNAIAHRMLVKDKNLDFTENFNAASKDMKTLYKSSSMLVDAFDYLSIYYNPSSAAFGKRRPVDLYKLVDKIRIILSSAEGASLNKKIYIIGNLRISLDLYESFKIIPFCFLQNAIKYSFNSDITITFSTTSRDVEMAIESSGPPIGDAEKEKIFEKGYRGNLSKSMHHEGEGIGLYIAKIVADAHNLELKVKSISNNYQREGIPVHSNTFSVRIPIGTHIERRNVPR